MASIKRITGRAPALATVLAAKPAQATARIPEPKGVTQARAAINTAANDFEVARQAYAAAGDRLNDAQIALARAMAAPT